jgi:thiol-disulfide isomerase/thioredoxin
VKRSGKLLAVAAAVVAATVGFAACSGGKNAVDQAAGGQFRYVQSNKTGTLIPAAQRKAAGPVSGALLSNGNYSLAADRGGVVVLNFFASWCGPCKVETPQLELLYQARKATGVKVVGLDVKETSKSQATAFIEDKKISYPIVYDESAKTAQQLGKFPVRGLPATALIDKQGRVAAIYSVPVLPADLNPVLDTLVKES